MIWSDNVVCFARSQAAALEMIEQWKNALWDVARCTVKPGSCVIVPSSVRKFATRQVSVGDLVVDIKAEERILGAYITCNGSETVNRRLLVGRLEASFARNRKVLCRDWCDEEARLRFWGTLMRGALYGAGCLRPILETFNRLTVTNNTIIRRIQNVLRQPWENITVHRKHVGAEASYARDELGLDIELEFCKQIVRWVGHIWRHPDSHIFSLIQHQGDSWLQGRRRQHSSHRPGTRTEPGCVFRWAEGWLDLVHNFYAVDGGSISGWSFAKNNKNSVRVRAAFLKDWVRPPRANMGALEDLSQALVSVS